MASETAAAACGEEVSAPDKSAAAKESCDCNLLSCTLALCCALVSPLLVEEEKDVDEEEQGALHSLRVWVARSLSTRSSPRASTAPEEASTPTTYRLPHEKRDSGSGNTIGALRHTTEGRE